jgi:DNA-binding CsgD family transcriptional regulator
MEFAINYVHLTWAMQLDGRVDGLDREPRIGFAALESLAIGAMVVEADGQVLFANPTAEATLRAAQGLTVRHGILHAQDRSKDKALHRVIGQAALAAQGRPRSSGDVLNLDRPEGRPLSVLVRPLPPESMGVDSVRPIVAIFTANPDDEPCPPQEVLAELWGLTTAEASLTAAVVKGERLSCYAQRRGISLATAKTQLQQVFAKIGCTRQSELIRVLLANPVLRMCGERHG